MQNKLILNFLVKSTFNPIWSKSLDKTVELVELQQNQQQQQQPLFHKKSNYHSLFHTL
jgi:hypothetical protein